MALPHDHTETQETDLMGISSFSSGTTIATSCSNLERATDRLATAASNNEMARASSECEKLLLRRSVIPGDSTGELYLTSCELLLSAMENTKELLSRLEKSLSEALSDDLFDQLVKHLETIRDCGPRVVNHLRKHSWHSEGCVLLVFPAPDPCNCTGSPSAARDRLDWKHIREELEQATAGVQNVANQL